ncbi:hypothetical protein Tsubulata_034381 [Turnera subulata]|uniref:Bifunctional inhibitor/plant lipid transfer protein/seed storage helical domain-containing protein n=1 Tax=Turnera subulata TaxID=218843 RepID=A0A9Q0JLN8_9ROSI|nr:hypothetical protein Tsubulata_034381 [Turnera subulata]
MASKGIELCVVLVLVMVLCHGAMAQSGCTSALMNLAPCLNYVTGNSSTPSSSCCSQLANIVQSRPQCLCTLVNGGGSSLGITINQTLALSLPEVCKVQTPPVSKCNANPPETSAASPPAESSSKTPEAPAATSLPSTPAGSGSKTGPATVGTSDANVMRTQVLLTMLAIVVLSYASNAIRF